MYPNDKSEERGEPRPVIEPRTRGEQEPEDREVSPPRGPEPGGVHLASRVPESVAAAVRAGGLRLGESVSLFVSRACQERLARLSLPTGAEPAAGPVLADAPPPAGIPTPRKGFLPTVG